MSTYTSILADVERACNSPEALSRLLKELLEFTPESGTQRAYVAALVSYVLYKRRKEIWLRDGRDVCRTFSGCGPVIEFELARDRARSLEEELAGEMGLEAVRDLKRRWGRRLSLRACVERVRNCDWRE